MKEKQINKEERKLMEVEIPRLKELRKGLPNDYKEFANQSKKVNELQYKISKAIAQ